MTDLIIAPGEYDDAAGDKAVVQAVCHGWAFGFDSDKDVACWRPSDGAYYSDKEFSDESEYRIVRCRAPTPVPQRHTHLGRHRPTAGRDEGGALESGFWRMDWPRPCSSYLREKRRSR